MLCSLISRIYIPEPQASWRWKSANIAVRDNRRPLHHAVMDYPPHHRKMERAGIIGDQSY